MEQHRLMIIDIFCRYDYIDCILSITVLKHEVLHELLLHNFDKFTKPPTSPKVPFWGLSRNEINISQILGRQTIRIVICFAFLSHSVWTLL